MAIVIKLKAVELILVSKEKELEHTSPAIVMNLNCSRVPTLLSRLSSTLQFLGVHGHVTNIPQLAISVPGNSRAFSMT
jgi:hypothetical protein